MGKEIDTCVCTHIYCTQVHTQMMDMDYTAPVWQLLAFSSAVVSVVMSWWFGLLTAALIMQYRTGVVSLLWIQHSSTNAKRTSTSTLTANVENIKYFINSSNMCTFKLEGYPADLYHQKESRNYFVWSKVHCDWKTISLAKDTVWSF